MKELKRLITDSLNTSQYSATARSILPYNGQIYVLTNKTTGSTAEHLTALLKGQPNVTLIGQNTSGNFHYANNGIFQLKHSRLLVSVVTDHVGFYDNTNIEKIGLEPDIKIAVKEDALEWLQRNKKNQLTGQSN